MIAAGGRYIYHASRTDTFKIWALADFHLGNAGTHEKMLDAHLAQISADPFSFWVGVGDYADYIGYKDKRFDPATLGADLMISDLGKLGRVLTERVRDKLKPIAGKCLGLAYGNHEAKYMQQEEQQDLHAWLCSELAVPNLGYSFLMDVIFMRKNSPSKFGKVFAKPGGKGCAVAKFRLYGHHGAGASSTPSGKARRLQTFMESFRADAYVMGHVHGKHVENLVEVGADRGCGELIEHTRIGTITGSYLKTYQQGPVAGYGEQAGYKPSPLGAAIIEFTPDTRELSVKLTARLRGAE